jgi:hypothetical protein
MMANSLYSNIYTSVLNNDWISNIFGNIRGIRQSFPLLVLLFALEVDIMIFKDKKE